MQSWRVVVWFSVRTLHSAERFPRCRAAVGTRVGAAKRIRGRPRSGKERRLCGDAVKAQGRQSRLLACNKREEIRAEREDRRAGGTTVDTRPPGFSYCLASACTPLSVYPRCRSEKLPLTRNTCRRRKREREELVLRPLGRMRPGDVFVYNRRLVVITALGAFR